MKRFTKLERARQGDDEIETPATAKRFAGIEPPPGATAAPQRDPFAPPTEPTVPLQLELHDRYSGSVEEARRDRQQRATQQAETHLAKRAAQEVAPRPGALDHLGNAMAVGPLARLGLEARIWLLGGAGLALWLVTAPLLGAAGAIAAVGILVGLLAIRATARKR
jgi:hypothetical protein